MDGGLSSESTNVAPFIKGLDEAKLALPNAFSLNAKLTEMTMAALLQPDVS